jgi:acetylornithine/succinyldiaminopimelate/putrescine aminotransferase/predicted amino acid dehydrogenase
MLGSTLEVSKLLNDLKSSASYSHWCKPELSKLLRMLGLDVTYTRAVENSLFRSTADRGEIQVLDLLGGYGSTILGHNHPEVCDALMTALNQHVAIHAQASLRPESAALGEHLNHMIAQERGLKNLSDHYQTHLFNTGAEAVEAAMKHALMAWQEKKSAQTSAPVFFCMEGSYHGKTAGALAVTSNPSFGVMYPQPAVQTVFIRRDSTREELETLFANYTQGSFTQIAGVLLEVIQGEGGVICLREELLRDLAELSRRAKVPLIVDEIQSGMYRAGRLLASHEFALDPDYILLGKSLGGGYAKISAFLVKASCSVGAFDLMHGSTFSEDGLSSIVALRTLQVLEKMSVYLPFRAYAVQEQFLQGILEIQKKYPGVIREGRGRGFFLAVEFEQDQASLVLDALESTGYMSYVMSSYLLHRHDIRLGATLSRPNTLRIEPSALLSDQHVQHLLQSLDEMTALLYKGQVGQLLAHLIRDPQPGLAEVVSRRPARLKVEPGLRRVVFLSHFLDSDHVQDMDPLFDQVGAQDREWFLHELGAIFPGVTYHQQMIEGLGGERVLFELYGLPLTSHQIEQSILQRDHVAYDKIRQAAEIALAEGAFCLGLGQYTSIATVNGRRLLDLGLPVTTGNSLTVGLAVAALKSLLQERGLSASKLRLGIVGAAGNIGNVIAQIFADEGAALTLIHRESYETSGKFQDAVARIEKNSSLQKETLVLGDDWSLLHDCDAVVLSTNSPEQLLLPKHLKQGAIVLDVSVPSNFHPRIALERPDVVCFQGGFARLPRGQTFENKMVSAPEGQIFACMAETLMMGLHGISQSYSVGPVTKERVRDALEKAESAGIGLGSLKKFSVF